MIHFSIVFLANDLAIENNRFISSIHCIFEFDNGHVFIRDTSSNGTLINRSRKIHKNDSVKK
jgi:predicted component of type VI protein secretion system